MGLRDFMTRATAREEHDEGADSSVTSPLPRELPAPKKKVHVKRGKYSHSTVGKLTGKAAAVAREVREEQKQGVAGLGTARAVRFWSGHCWVFAGLLVVSVVFDVVNQLQDCPDGCAASVWWSELGFQWLCVVLLGLMLFFEMRKYAKRGKLVWIVLLHLLAMFVAVDSALELGVMAIVFEIMAALGDDSD